MISLESIMFGIVHFRFLQLYVSVAIEFYILDPPCQMTPMVWPETAGTPNRLVGLPFR